MGGQVGQPIRSGLRFCCRWCLVEGVPMLCITVLFVISTQVTTVEFDPVISSNSSQDHCDLRCFYTNDAELIGNDLIESGIKLTFDDHRSPVTVLFWDGRIHCQNTIAENRGNFCWLFGHRGTLYFIHLQWIFSDDDFFFGNIQRKLSCRPIKICDFVLTLYLRPWLHVK